MAAIDRRRFLGAVLPGAVVAVAGVTAITTAANVVSSAPAEAMPVGADRLATRKTGDVAESAPRDISAQHWRRRRRRRWVCWRRRGRRICGWRWV